MNQAVGKRLMNVTSVLGILATLAVTIYFFHLGAFSNPQVLQQLVGERIILGPIIFILVQIIQVVIPIIPGGISNAAGVLIFGPFFGFLYSYIGVVIGSFILFSLGQKYGQPFVQTIVSEKNYKKYIGKLDSKGWDVFFTLAIFAPIAPDDALVVLTSLSKMSFKKFAIIILLGKIPATAAYSFILVYGGEFLTHFFAK